MNAPPPNNPNGARVVAEPTKKTPKPFPAMLEQFKKQVALALPRHLNADRMARIALTEYNKTPALWKCEPTTIFASVIIASQLGLEIGILGQGFLVPYNDRRRGIKVCQFIPGWQGLVDLAQRSGRSTVWTGAVFHGDTFRYMFGSNPYIKHKPKGESDPAKLEYVYSVGWVKDATRPILDVWEIGKIWRHRDYYNKVGNQHYSFENPEMYARKVPLLQVLKYMPRSPELALGMGLEHAAQTTGQNLDLDQAIAGQFSQLEESASGAEDEGSAPAAASIDDPNMSQTERAKAILRGREAERQQATEDDRESSRRGRKTAAAGKTSQDTPSAEKSPESSPEAATGGTEDAFPPFFDEPSAIDAVRLSKTPEALLKTFRDIVKDYEGTRRSLPQSIAVAAIRACTLEPALTAVWKEITRYYRDANLQLPLEVEAIYHERIEILEKT